MKTKVKEEKKIVIQPKWEMIYLFPIFCFPQYLQIQKNK